MLHFIWVFTVCQSTCLGVSFLQRVNIQKIYNPGPFPAILGIGPWPKLGKKIDLTSKLGEISDIEHYKGSKIYPQNQVILDCFMLSIPLKHKCLSIILIWVCVSHKLVVVVSKKKVKKNFFFFFFFFTFLNWENQTWYWEKR